MIRTLLFDLDGTLVDSYGPIAASLNAARRAFGLQERGEAEIRRAVGRGLEALMEENLGAGRVRQGVEIFRASYAELFREGTRLLPGVAGTLTRLAARGYRMAVASNKPAAFSREILAGLEIGALFGAVYGPEMVSRPKPDPEMLLAAIGRLGSVAGECAYVGDMALDVETARRAGLPVYLVASGAYSRDELEGAGADRLFDRFEDLLTACPPLPR